MTLELALQAAGSGAVIAIVVNLPFWLAALCEAERRWRK